MLSFASEEAIDEDELKSYDDGKILNLTASSLKWFHKKLWRALCMT